jgi:hypothetical protein
MNDLENAFLTSLECLLVVKRLNYSAGGFLSLSLVQAIPPLAFQLFSLNEHFRQTRTLFHQFLFNCLQDMLAVYNHIDSGTITIKLAYIASDMIAYADSV